MSGVSFPVTVSDPGLATALGRFVAAAKDLREPFDVIGAKLVASTQYRFERQTGPDGERWEPSQRALATGGVTLTDKGHLRDSFTYQAGRDRVVEGSALVYAGAQHFGGQVGRGHKTTLPARPIVGVDDDDALMILTEIESWMARSLP